VINWTLLHPRNFVVIGIIAVAAHILLSPIFSSIGTDKQANG
jgi:hypothetical protein